MGGIDVKSLFVKEVTTLKKKRKEHFILWGEWGGIQQQQQRLAGKRH
jgi:hypothetical protein